MEKILSCGEISDFCKEFEQFMEFYRNLCRFCSKFVWRKSLWRKNDKYEVCNSADTVLNPALSRPLSSRVKAWDWLFIFKTVSRFQFYPESDLEKHIYSGNPQTGGGDLGIRGNIWIKKSNKRRSREKRSFHILPIPLSQHPKQLTKRDNPPFEVCGDLVYYLR